MKWTQIWFEMHSVTSSISENQQFTYMFPHDKNLLRYFSVNAKLNQLAVLTGLVFIIIYSAIEN
jgi:hypothetical protein